MSPEALELAERQIRLRMLDAQSEFRERWNEMAKQFAPTNMNSSAFALAAHRLCSDELKRRALLAWEVIRGLIDSEGFTSSQDSRGQARPLLERAVTNESADVEKILSNRVHDTIRKTLGDSMKLDAGRAHALESALAAFDADMLRRVKRRPPLEDELSAPRYHPAREHWRKALAFASAAQPDLPNAVKEAAASVESLAQVVLDKPGITLGAAVKELRSLQKIPTGTDKVLEGLYAFASDMPGARHGSALAAHVDPSHWGFAKTVSEGALRLLLDLDA